MNIAFAFLLVSFVSVFKTKLEFHLEPMRDQVNDCCMHHVAVLGISARGIQQGDLQLVARDIHVSNSLRQHLSCRGHWTGYLLFESLFASLLGLVTDPRRNRTWEFRKLNKII